MASTPPVVGYRARTTDLTPSPCYIVPLATKNQAQILSLLNNGVIRRRIVDLDVPGGTLFSTFDQAKEAITARLWTRHDALQEQLRELNQKIAIASTAQENDVPLLPPLPAL